MYMHHDDNDTLSDVVGWFVIFIMFGLFGLFIWGGIEVYHRLTDPKPIKGWSLIYLNQYDQSTIAGTYATKQQCAQGLQIAINNPGKYDRPECGNNCKLSKTFTDMYVCDTTFEQ